MTVTLDALKTMYEKLDPITPKALVLSPESKETLFTLLDVKKADNPYASLLGIEIYTNPYLGNLIIFGEKERLKDLGLI